MRELNANELEVVSGGTFVEFWESSGLTFRCAHYIYYGWDPGEPDL